MNILPEKLRNLQFCAQLYCRSTDFPYLCKLIHICVYVYMRATLYVTGRGEAVGKSSKSARVRKALRVIKALKVLKVQKCESAKSSKSSKVLNV